LTFLTLNDNQLSGCYDPNLLNLCNQLDPLYTGNEYISDGNSLAPWEDFCPMAIGVCFEYYQTDAVCVIEGLQVDDVANETHFEVHLNSGTTISAYAISVVINVGTVVDTNDIQLNIDDSVLNPDTSHIDVDDTGNIHITLARTDKIDQIINGGIFKIVIMDDILPVVIMDDIFPKIIGGYMVSAITELTPIAGSTLYGSLDALVSLGVNHAYCENKGTAEIYVEENPNNYNYEWSTGETTPSIGDLNIGNYTLTVSDDIGTTMIIPFDITWAFTPVEININNNQIYIDFEEAPLSEEVEISLDGGHTYMSRTTTDVEYNLPNYSSQILIRRITDECSTYLQDFTTSKELPESHKLYANLANSLKKVPRLDYELGQYGTIDISLYNIHGQQLRTIHKATSGAGKYQVEIDKSNLPGGIYLIHIHFLSTDGTVAYKTLKLIV